MKHLLSLLTKEGGHEHSGRRIWRGKADSLSFPLSQSAIIKHEIQKAHHLAVVRNLASNRYTSQTPAFQHLIHMLMYGSQHVWHTSCHGFLGDLHPHVKIL